MTDRTRPTPRPEPTAEEAEASRRRFFERLTDWDDPNSIVLIKKGGVDVNPDGTPLVAAVETVAATVVDVDEDGNLLMSDGTIRVP